MTLTVADRARTIATFRAVEVRLMEIAAAWTPTTPEMEVKVLFGRHIWDFAQHADALGKRTFELRRPEQWSLPPRPEFERLLAEVAAIGETPGRLSVLYDALLPALERRYRAYAAETDSLLDAPSVAVIERILADHPRQRSDAERVRRENGLASAPPGLVEEIRQREAAIAEIVAPLEATA
jgi:hypothetical protein